jgi:hypothetical protein
LATSTPCTAVLVQNDPGSSNNLYVGNSTAQPINLKPGQAITIACSNLNLIYTKGNGGSATVNYLAIQ